MKLAWKELRHNKTKFILIESILILMIFMVIFLSGLAGGLARAVSASIENADADYFIISDSSENLITISSLSIDKLEEVASMTDNNVTSLNIQRTTLIPSGTDTKLDVTYFAVDPNSFLMPEIERMNETETTTTYNIVLNDSFKDDNIQIGDIIEDSSSGLEMTVVGFTKDQMYGHSPVGFISTNAYTAIKREINPTYEEKYNTIAVQGSDVDKIQYEGLEVVDKATIVKNIPGYSAEQVTINMILWVLVVISAAILGVFFYVITIQKQKQFGVLKAIGMNMIELTGIIISQVFILAIIGVVIGNLLVFGMSAMLPSSMPFYLNETFAILVSLVFIIISLLCSLISTRRVAKVDPIIIIGGNE
jgi:putative ABC transport system permease protein